MLQTTSFELSKQLDELAKSKGVELPVSSEPSHALEDKKTGICTFYSAYTTDELLAWLPYQLKIGKRDFYFEFSKNIEGGYYTDYATLDTESVGEWFTDREPSNALAKLAIYLIENDLLK